jgi:hypothetical protein
VIPHVQSVTAMLEHLRISLENEVGKISEIVLTGPSDTNEGVIKITPANLRSAPVGIVLDAKFGAYLTVGRGSIFEVPFEGKRHAGTDFVSEITNLVSGIANAGFQEDILVSKGKVVGASGSINAGGTLKTAVSDAWMKLGWRFLIKRLREHYTYPPYSQT